MDFRFRARFRITIVLVIGKTRSRSILTPIYIGPRSLNKYHRNKIYTRGRQIIVDIDEKFMFYESDG